MKDTSQRISVRRHICYVYNRNIGNHLLGCFFAKHVQALLLPQRCDIYFSGIAELAVSPERVPSTEGLEPPRRHHDELIQRCFNDLTGETLHIDIRPHEPDLGRIARLSTSYSLAIHVILPVCNLKFLPGLSECKKLVPGKPDIVDAARRLVGRYQDHYLFVNVRAGDILSRPSDSIYSVTPIEFIRSAQAMADKPLLFYGQTQDSLYMRMLIKNFPGSVVIKSTSRPSIDFEVGRLAQYLLVSVSTFSFVSAWLSERAQRVYFPVLGFYDQARFPNIDLIPAGDGRFVSVSVKEFEEPSVVMLRYRRSLGRILARIPWHR